MSVSILNSSIASEMRCSFGFSDLALTVAKLGLSALYDLSTSSRSMVGTCTIFLMLAPYFAVFSNSGPKLLFLSLRSLMVLIVLAGKPSRF